MSNVTAQLRRYGFTDKEIKKINNNLRYRGMPFKRITAIDYVHVVCDSYEGIEFRFIDDNNGEILGIFEKYIRG